MKRLIILSLLMLSFNFIRSQTVQSSCVAPDSVIKKYKRDADRMAIRRTIAINSTYKDSGKINPVISKQYLDALLAVYNATTIPAVDTVINKLKIHRQLEEVNSFDFMADSTLSWMINLKNNISPTGFPAFDNLKSKYNFQKAGMYDLYLYGVGRLVTLRADTNYNIPEIAKQFSLVSGVYPNIISYPPPACPVCPFYLGLPRFISDSINVNFIILTYTYGWGDCPSGCPNQRHWKFKVYNDCSVEYLGSSGSPFQFVGIKERNFDENNFKLYPNPTTGKLFVDASEVNKITITDYLGQTVVTLDNPITQQEIDLSLFSRGVYFLTLQSNFKQSVFKIIKE